MKRRRKKKRTCKKGTILQTILMSRKKYNQKTAKTWLKKHGFKTYLDVKPNTLRSRQESPTSFNRSSFRTINLKTGIKAVIGCPR